jgi:hypothetical protein
MNIDDSIKMVNRKIVYIEMKPPSPTKEGFLFMGNWKYNSNCLAMCKVKPYYYVK